MATTSLTHDLGSLFQGGSATGLSDRQLIERFVTRRDEAGEAAFAALVARHGPMVLGVCRQILGDLPNERPANRRIPSSRKVLGFWPDFRGVPGIT